jgi:Fe2+ transport system protein FeoA
MHSAIELTHLKPGECATITALHTDHSLYYRLAALGFRVGKRVEVIRHARFSGPMQVRIGTTDIMLRRREAQNISVLPC